MVSIIDEIPKTKKPRRMIVFLPSFIKAKEATAVPIALMIEIKEDMRCPISPDIILTETASQ